MAEGEEGTGEEGTGEEEGTKGKEEGAGEDVSWRDSITDEATRKQADRFTTPEAAVKSTLDLRQMLSKSVVIPGKDSSDEEVASYKKAIGMPEKVEDYEITVDDDAPEGSADFWKETFFNNNITPDQANNLNDAVKTLVVKNKEAQLESDKEYAAASTEELKKEWPGKEYDTNVEFSKRAVAKLAGTDADALFEMEDKAGNMIMDNPMMLRMFAGVGREMDEGRIGVVASESDVQTYLEKADEARENAKIASAKGKVKEAQRYDAEEREWLDKIPEQTR